MKNKNKAGLLKFTQPQRFFYIRGVAASVVLSNCFLNDLSVKNMSLFNFHRKKTV